MSNTYIDVITDLLPEVYDSMRSGDFLESRGDSEWRKSQAVSGEITTFSRSTSCEYLSYVMFKLLDSKGVPVRREFHVHPYSNQWHFLLAHTSENPDETDLITDLNPWTFADDDKTLPDFLHLPRNEAYDEVIKSGSHRVRAECLLISTIATNHMTELAWDDTLLHYDAGEDIRLKAQEGYDFGFSDWRND